MFFAFVRGGCTRSLPFYGWRAVPSSLRSCLPSMEGRVCCCAAATVPGAVETTPLRYTTTLRAPQGAARCLPRCHCRRTGAAGRAAYALPAPPPSSACRCGMPGYNAPRSATRGTAASDIAPCLQLRVYRALPLRWGLPPLPLPAPSAWSAPSSVRAVPLFARRLGGSALLDGAWLVCTVPFAGAWRCGRWTDGVAGLGFEVRRDNPTLFLRFLAFTLPLPARHYSAGHACHSAAFRCG